MRTKERWESAFKEASIKANFSPRIVRDLLQIPNMLDTEEIESAFIYGKVGTGKTLLAAQMMLQEMENQFLQKPDAVYGFEFINFSDMLYQIRATFNNGKENAEEKLDRYRNCGLLVIDDFGASRMTDWVIEIVYQIINARYENLGKTIITSNESLEELEANLGDQRITSRINRMCKIIEKLPFSPMPD